MRRWGLGELPRKRLAQIERNRMDTLLKIITKIKTVGPLNILGALLWTTRNWLLYAFYGFDKWHIKAHFYNRPYKQKVASIINSVHPQTVVEIGCGLGDILSHCEAQTILGIDLEENTIRAARLVNRRSMLFAIGNFLEPDTICQHLIANRIAQLNILVMINWVHNYNIATIVRSVAAINLVAPVHFIVIDTIKDGAESLYPGYKYHHGKDINQLGQVVETVDADEVRSIVLINYDE
jgi:2-polyprenyl-3-methyl-5-hydroxy-6-metoxy-1,4-benzoquinol methylase